MLNADTKNQGPRKTTLVLSTCPQTLAVVRSLSAAGEPVVLGYSNRSHITRSRACVDSWRHLPINSPGFGAQLCVFLSARQDIDCVFPVGESAIEIIHGLADDLPSDVAVAAVPAQLFSVCHDKNAANQLAEQAGLRVPKYAIVKSHAELLSATQAIGWPVIVKSVRTEARVFGRKAYIVENREQFDAVFKQWPAMHKDLVVQQYIRGTPAGADYVARDGEILCYYECAVRRTDRLDGTGFAVEFESSAPSLELLEVISAFVKHANYTGPGLLQCIRCSDTGELYFIENNARLAAGAGDTMAAGLDLPLYAFNAVVKPDRIQSPKPRTIADFTADYRAGHRTHWLERDIRGWLDQRSQLSARESARWVVRMVWASIQANAHMNWRWSDPAPSVSIYMSLLRRAVRSVFRPQSNPSGETQRSEPVALPSGSGSVKSRALEWPQKAA